MDYLGYWGLNSVPFENTRNTKFFYASHDHMEALQRLLYLVRSGSTGFAMLTGEIGCGKTITRTVLEKQLASSNYKVVGLENSNFPFNYLVAEAITVLTGDKIVKEKSNKYEIMELFRDIMREQIIRRDVHLVIILDEAQEIGPKTLVELKNLTNINAEDKNYLTFILVGQPELRMTIKTLPQLDQRIGLRFHLNPLSTKESGEYMEHRLRIAGHPTGKIFTQDAIDAIARDTNGVPREINRIGQLSLDLAFSLEGKEVSKAIVNTIIKDLHKQNGLQ